MRLFTHPNEKTMRQAIIKYYNKVYDESDWLKEEYPNRKTFLGRIKNNIRKKEGNELIKAYYQIMPSYV